MAMASCPLVAGEYFEGFDTPGKPPARDGIRWGYTDELTPVEGWKSILPGDGYAHLSVSSKTLSKPPDRKNPSPFQTLSLGPVGINHRISIRAKNAAIPGVACLLFTYREKSGVDEIDIEIAAIDTQTPGSPHGTGSDGGWTDARFNTWATAREVPPSGSGKLRPSRTLRTPIRDALGRRISHRDGLFHTYTIEWRRESVRFFIDGVLQGLIREVVPDHSATIIFGMRRMTWSGIPDWQGTRTMLVDWIDIESLDAP